MKIFLLYFCAGQTTQSAAWHAVARAVLSSGHAQIRCAKGLLIKTMDEQLQEP